MKAIDPAKLQTLLTFLGQLPERYRLLLAEVSRQALEAGADDLPYAEMLDACTPLIGHEEPAAEAIDRPADADKAATADDDDPPEAHEPRPTIPATDLEPLVYAPVTDLLYTRKPGAAKEPGRIDRSTLAPLWTWLTDALVPELIEEARANAWEFQKAGDYAGEQQALALLQSEIGVSLIEAYEALGEKTLADRLGDAAAARDALEIGVVLTVGAELSAFFDSWPPKIDELTQDLLIQAKELHDHLVTLQPSISPLLAFLIMARLSRPWQIFRFIEKLTHRRDDLILPNTDLGSAGTAILDQADAYASEITFSQLQTFDVPVTLKHLRRFTALSEGLVSEFGIRKGGTWGKRLMEVRGKVSKVLETVCSATLKSTDAALPRSRQRGKGNSGLRPDVSKPIKPENLQAAINGLAFLQFSRPLARAAAFSSARGNAVAAAGDKLDLAANDILDILGQKDAATRDLALDYAIAVYQMLAALGQGDAAAVFGKRLRALMPDLVLNDPEPVKALCAAA